jgi:hypothetical protein
MDKKVTPSSLAVDPELRASVRERARENGLTTLELTNLLIGFALKYCEVEIPAPRTKPNQLLLSILSTPESAANVF